MSCWLILPVALFFVSASGWLPVPRGWISWNFSTLPLGILAALGIAAVQKAIKSLRFGILCITVFLSALLGLSLLLTHVYTIEKMEIQQHLEESVYPAVGVWQSIMTLANAPAGSGVLALPLMGNVVPAYTPVHVFLGKQDGTSDWVERRTFAYTFYQGNMTEKDAYQILKGNNISYVFYGPEEQSITQAGTFYPALLGIVFQNPEVTIYAVR